MKKIRLSKKQRVLLVLFLYSMAIILFILFEKLRIDILK
ncbi:hypothetical protein ABH968_001401 [Lysinibacillus sp. RC79]